MQQVVLFFNPLSGRFKSALIPQWVSTMESQGLQVTVVSDPAQLRLLQQAHIIVAGGDGTFHTAINHADVKTNSFSIMPVGSGNDFASNFKRRDIAELAAQIKCKQYVQCDIMRINEVYVHNVCGVGFEALVAEKARKTKPASLKYIIPVMRNLFVYKPIRAKIEADNFHYHDRVFMVSMGNGEQAGGGFKLFPKAKLNDGKLDLLLIKPPNLWQRLLYVFLVNLGKHLTLKPVEFRQVSSCSIELEGVETFQADGELYKADKLMVQVLPGCLTLV